MGKLPTMNRVMKRLGPQKNRVNQTMYAANVEAERYERVMMVGDVLNTQRSLCRYATGVVTRLHIMRDVPVAPGRTESQEFVELIYTNGCRSVVNIKLVYFAHFYDRDRVEAARDRFDNHRKAILTYNACMAVKNTHRGVHILGVPDQPPLTAKENAGPAPKVDMSYGPAARGLGDPISPKSASSPAKKQARLPYP